MAGVFESLEDVVFRFFFLTPAFFELERCTFSNLASYRRLSMKGCLISPLACL